LQLLKQTKNQLNYQFLVQWAKLTLQDHNSESQIPTLSVQGTGSLSAQSNWLGIYDKEITQGAQLVYHPKNDWQLTLGQLMGIQEGTALKILLNSKKTMPAKVIKVGVDFAKVELGKEVKEQLDNKKIYPVIIPTLYSPLKIYLHDIDENTTQKELVQQSLQRVEEVSWSTPKESQFYLNIFNQMVYFSLPNTPFQPLNHQLPLAIKKATLENSLMEDIIALKKWNHFHTLYHPNQLTNTPKIKVELIDANTKKVIDILDGVHTLKALPERAGKEWAAKFQIKVTNSSTQDLYIAVLTLGSDMSITAKPFYNQSILLPPQKTKYFYDFEPYHRMAQCSLDTYKEVYNWPYEWFYYKFIVTEAGDFSASIPSFLQQGFYPPRLIGNPMGAVDRKQHLNQENYWAVYTSTIHLKNPTYNEISGHLAEQLDEYLAEDRIAPFLKKVYPDDILINQ